MVGRVELSMRVRGLTDDGIPVSQLKTVSEMVQRIVVLFSIAVVGKV